MATTTKKGMTAEHVMLVVLLVLSGVFLTIPIIQDYPRDARIFPQMMAGAVFVGSFLLLIQDYLPDPVRTFVAEDMTITSTDDITDTTPGTDEDEDEGEPTVDDEGEDEEEEADQYGEMSPRLGEEYGIEINDTVFMVATATLYFIAGWAAGFLIMTLPFVFLYMIWFRIPWTIALGSAVFATVIIWFFMTFLILPFDQGEIIDLSPLLPFVIDSMTSVPASMETGFTFQRGVI